MKRKLFSVALIVACCILMQAVTVSAENKPLNVSSKSAYLVDYESGQVIYSHNENEKRPIASMCKIMTLLLTFEHIDNGGMKYDDTLTISHAAASMGGSQVFLSEGGNYKVSDLIKTVVVASANDSSVALSEAIAGSAEAFVQKMNSRATELKMTNTKFVNPTGLPAPDQYSTARDVSVMTRELLKHKKYYEYTKVWTEDFVHPDGRTTNITNTNKLVRFYSGCDSGKTGYTSEAGHCLSCSAIRNNMRLVAVIIGAPDSKTRFKEISDMMNFGFNAYESKIIISKDTPLEIRAKVKGGKADELSLYLKDNLTKFAKKGEKTDDLMFEYDIPNMVKAPIAKGDIVGNLLVLEGGVVKYEIPVLAGEDVQKSTLLDIIKNIIKSFGIMK